MLQSPFGDIPIRIYFLDTVAKTPQQSQKMSVFQEMHPRRKDWCCSVCPNNAAMFWFASDSDHNSQNQQQN